MNNFLLNINGLSSEDLTTEVLKYVLVNQDYKPYQRLFYNYLLGNSEGKCTEDYAFEVQTQATIELLGRPDMIIQDSSDHVYILENKFYAEFSQGDQIKRYVEILKKEYPSYKKRFVFLLGLKSRLDYYKHQVQNMIDTTDLFRNDIVIEYRSWEKVLEIFESDNFVISALKQYIETKFLRTIEFSEEETTMLQNKEIPKNLEKLFNLISDVRDKLSQSYGTERMSQSLNYYGFYAGIKVRKLWFGYFFRLWSKEFEPGIVTPIYVQIQKGWLGDIGQNFSIDKQLKDQGYYFEEGLQYVKPVPANLLSNPDQLVSFIEKEIQFINSLN